MQGAFFMRLNQNAVTDTPHKLYIFLDCDFTLIKGHTHNTIMRADIDANLKGDDLKNAEWDLVKHYEAYGDAKRWCEVLMQAIDKGHELAMVSYSEFPHIIARLLRETIGLDEKYAGKIKIESWLGSFGKNEHIGNVMRERQIEITPDVASRIIFMDDDPSNIAYADQQGYVTILVNRERDDHIERLASCIEQHNEKFGLNKPAI